MVEESGKKQNKKNLKRKQRQEMSASNVTINAGYM